MHTVTENHKNDVNKACMHELPSMNKVHDVAVANRKPIHEQGWTAFKGCESFASWCNLLRLQQIQL